MVLLALVRFAGGVLRSGLWRLDGASAAPGVGGRLVGNVAERILIGPIGRLLRLDLRSVTWAAPAVPRGLLFARKRARPPTTRSWLRLEELSCVGSLEFFPTYHRVSDGANRTLGRALSAFFWRYRRTIPAEARNPLTNHCSTSRQDARRGCRSEGSGKSVDVSMEFAVAVLRYPSSVAGAWWALGHCW